MNKMIHLGGVTSGVVELPHVSDQHDDDQGEGEESEHEQDPDDHGHYLSMTITYS